MITNIQAPSCVGLLEASQVRLHHTDATLGANLAIKCVYPNNVIEDITARFVLASTIVASKLSMYVATISFNKAGLYTFIAIDDATATPVVCSFSSTYSLPFAQNLDTSIKGLAKQRTNIDMLRTKLDANRGK